MSEDIVYIYDNNFAHLDSIGTAGRNVDQLGQDAHNLFTTMADFYKGAAATALLDAVAQKVTQQLDQVSTDIQGLQQQGVDRQHETHSMDNHLANNF